MSTGAGTLGLPRLEAPAHRTRIEQAHLFPRVAVVLAMILPLFALETNRSGIPEETRNLAAIFWVLCLLPSFAYFFTAPARRPPIPFMPLIGLMHGLYYALPPIVGDGISSIRAHLDPPDYVAPVHLAFTGWCVLLGAYWITGLMVSPKNFLRGKRWSIQTMRKWGMLIMLGGLAIEVGRQAFPLPSVIGGIATFAGSLALFGASLLLVLNTRKLLSPMQRLVLYGAILVDLALQAGSGLVSNVAMVALTIFVALWVSKGRIRLIWIIPAVALGAVFIAMRGVIIEYRRAVWYGDDQQVSVAMKPAIMAGMLRDKVNTEGPAAAFADGWKAAAGRSGSLDVFADVMIQTPRRVPYWGGHTYLTLVGLAIPRVLWPGKPQKVLGQEFGHRYSYLDEFDTGTSINLPFLIEFYLNFGQIGVVLGMLLVGVIYRVLEKYVNNPGQSILTSMCGLMLLLPLRNIESDFSLIFGGLLLNGLALKLMITFVSQTTATRDAQATAHAAVRRTA